MGPALAKRGPVPGRYQSMCPPVNPCLLRRIFMRRQRVGGPETDALERAMDDTETVIVTGASGGIGKAIVHTFRNHGYNVVASSPASLLDEFPPHSNLAPVKGDIGPGATAKETARTAISTFGSIDHVVMKSEPPRLVDVNWRKSSAAYAVNGFAVKMPALLNGPSALPHRNAPGRRSSTEASGLSRQ